MKWNVAAPRPDRGCAGRGRPCAGRSGDGLPSSGAGLSSGERLPPFFGKRQEARLEIGRRSRSPRLRARPAPQLQGQGDGADRGRGGRVLGQSQPRDGLQCPCDAATGQAREALSPQQRRDVLFRHAQKP